MPSLSHGGRVIPEGRAVSWSNAHRSVSWPRVFLAWPRLTPSLTRQAA
jgi:hypothetical protein